MKDNIKDNTSPVKPNNSDVIDTISTGKSLVSLFSLVGGGIFDITVRPDCKVGNSTWFSDFVPVVGYVNYMRRMSDATGIGTELFYGIGLMAYQIGSSVVIYKGLEQLF